MSADYRLDSRDYLWLCLAAGIILSIAFIMPVHPNDFWWYLRLGEEIITQGSIPQVEAWSSTQAGQPVVYHAWLSALVFTGLNRAGGIQALVLARGLSLMAFYALIFLSTRREGAGPRLAAGLIILSVLVGCGNWGVRPQLLTYPLFGLAIFILVSWRQGINRWLWLLPVITLLWVNLHGSFPLVFLLVGAALLGGNGKKRMLVVSLAFMLLASFLNPHCWGAWHYFFQMLADSSVRRFSSEWKPTTLDGWQSALFFGWLLVSGALAAYSNRRLPLFYWLWWFGFGWLALSGVRNIIWFSAILALVSAALLGSVGLIKPLLLEKAENSKLNLAIGTFLLLLTGFFLPGLRQGWWAQAPPVLSPDTPVRAAGWLAGQADIGGKMWNDLDFSSYLIYTLPEHPVWIDTRFEVYPPESWVRYQEISAAAEGWQGWLDDQGIDLVVANHFNQPALIAGLRAQPGWCLRYHDPAATVFTRTAMGVRCPAAVAGLEVPGESP